LKNSSQKFKSIVEKIKDIDRKAEALAQARLDSLTKPQGSLGRLEELAKQIAAVTGILRPDFSKKLIIVMAADHGVVEEGVSAYPKEVTPQMVHNFLSGGAAINVLSGHVGADVAVIDIGVAEELKGAVNLSDLAEILSAAKQKGKEKIEGEPYLYKQELNKNVLDIISIINAKDAKNAESVKKQTQMDSILIDKKVAYGTSNMVKGAAMTEEQAVSAVEAGIEVAEEMISLGYGIIGTGDMGIGNTTASSAVASCICGVDAELVTGYGTGINETGYKKKVDVIRRALEINKPDAVNGMDVLAKVGGFEIGGIAGVILACASRKVPVVIDGFISGAAALIAEAVSPKCRDYMIASHCSVERGHKIVLEKLKLKPLFNFDMRLGEGTGAAIGISIAEAAVKILNQMATFDEAGVSKKNE